MSSIIEIGVSHTPIYIYYNGTMPFLYFAVKPSLVALGLATLPDDQRVHMVYVKFGHTKTVQIGSKRMALHANLIL